MERHNIQNSQQVIYPPTDLIDVTKEQLKTAGALVTVEGMYVQCSTKEYHAVLYPKKKKKGSTRII